MTDILGLITGPVGAFLAGILALVGAWVFGARHGRQRAALREAEGYQKTMQEAINAPVHTDASVARRRMRDRDQR